MSHSSQHSDYDDRLDPIQEAIWFPSFHGPGDVLYAGSDDEQSPAQIAAKHARYEVVGRRIQHGTLPVLISVGLRGPLDGWTNPWRHQGQHVQRQLGAQEAKVRHGKVPQESLDQIQDQDPMPFIPDSTRQGTSLTMARQGSCQSSNRMTEEFADISTVKIAAQPSTAAAASMKRPIDKTWLKGSYVSKKARWDLPEKADSPTPMIARSALSRAPSAARKSAYLPKPFESSTSKVKLHREGSGLRLHTENSTHSARRTSRSLSQKDPLAGKFLPSTSRGKAPVDTNLDQRNVNLGLGIYNSSMDTPFERSTIRPQMQQLELDEPSSGSSTHSVNRAEDLPIKPFTQAQELYGSNIKSESGKLPTLSRSSIAPRSAGRASFITEIAPSSRDLEKFQFRKRKTRKTSLEATTAPGSKQREREAAKTGTNDRIKYVHPSLPAIMTSRVRSEVSSRMSDDSWILVEDIQAEAPIFPNAEHHLDQLNGHSLSPVQKSFDSAPSSAIPGSSPESQHVSSYLYARQIATNYSEMLEQLTSSDQARRSGPRSSQSGKRNSYQCRQVEEAYVSDRSIEHFRTSPDKRERISSGSRHSGQRQTPIETGIEEPSSLKLPKVQHASFAKKRAHTQSPRSQLPDPSDQSRTEFATSLRTSLRDGLLASGGSIVPEFNVSTGSASRFQLQLQSQSPLKFDGMEAIFAANNWNMFLSSQVGAKIVQDNQSDVYHTASFKPKSPVPGSIEQSTAEPDIAGSDKIESPEPNRHSPGSRKTVMLSSRSGSIDVDLQCQSQIKVEEEHRPLISPGSMQPTSSISPYKEPSLASSLRDCSPRDQINAKISAGNEKSLVTLGELDRQGSENPVTHKEVRASYEDVQAAPSDPYGLDETTWSSLSPRKKAAPATDSQAQVGAAVASPPARQESTFISWQKKAANNIEDLRRRHGTSPRTSRGSLASTCSSLLGDDNDISKTDAQVDTDGPEKEDDDLGLPQGPASSIDDLDIEDDVADQSDDAQDEDNSDFREFDPKDSVPQEEVRSQDTPQSNRAGRSPQSPWTDVLIEPLAGPNKPLVIEESILVNEATPVSDAGGWQVVDHSVDFDFEAIVPFRELMSPSPPIQSSPLKGLLSTQMLVEVATSNPWASRLKTPGSRKTTKRVSFGNISERDTHSEERVSSKKRRSPPPPKSPSLDHDETLDQLEDSSPGFKRHFHVMSAYRPAQTNQSGFGESQGSPDIQAMADAFVAADRVIPSPKPRVSSLKRKKLSRSSDVHIAEMSSSTPHRCASADLGSRISSNRIRRQGEQEDQEETLTSAYESSTSPLSERSHNVGEEVQKFGFEGIDDMLGGPDWSVDAELKAAREKEVEAERQDNAAKRRRLFGIDR